MAPKAKNQPEAKQEQAQLRCSKPNAKWVTEKANKRGMKQYAFLDLLIGFAKAHPDFQ